MREKIRALLLAYAPFSSLIPTVVEAGSVTPGVSREPPFAVVRMGVITPGPGRAVTRSMELWVHDTPGDYGRIDAALKAARTGLDVWSLSTSTGWLMRARWTGSGGDAYDDGHKTITRQGSWELTGTGE